MGGGRLPERGVEGAGLGERDREDGAEAVDDVEPEEERDAEAALLDRDALRRAHSLPAPEVEEAADLARPQVGVDVAADLRAGDGEVGAEDGELADLLVERHPADEIRDLRGRRAQVEPGQRRAGGDEREDAAAVGHQPGR